MDSIEFTFNYPWIGYARIEECLEDSWRRSVTPRKLYESDFYHGDLEKARFHDYEN